MNSITESNVEEKVIFVVVGCVCDGNAAVPMYVRWLFVVVSVRGCVIY